jgi:hypothetical protein
MMLRFGIVAKDASPRLSILVIGSLPTDAYRFTPPFSPIGSLFGQLLRPNAVLYAYRRQPVAIARLRRALRAKRPNAQPRDPPTRVLRRKVAFFDARMRGGVPANGSGQAAKARERQLRPVELTPGTLARHRGNGSRVWGRGRHRGPRQSAALAQPDCLPVVLVTLDECGVGPRS